MAILVIVVQIGKIVKYDEYGRITCPAALADLLDLVKGVDEVTWNIEGGKVVVKKVTKEYAGGFDPESDEIAERLTQYEKDRVDEYDGEELNFDEAQARALEEYKKDKEAREALKKAKKK